MGPVPALKKTAAAAAWQGLDSTLEPDDPPSRASRSRARDPGTLNAEQTLTLLSASID
jgi:hypothetical protein